MSLVDTQARSDPPACPRNGSASNSPARNPQELRAGTLYHRPETKASQLEEAIGVDRSARTARASRNRRSASVRVHRPVGVPREV